MSEELMMSAAGEERSITTITDEIIFYIPSRVSAL